MLLRWSWTVIKRHCWKCEKVCGRDQSKCCLIATFQIWFIHSIFPSFIHAKLKDMFQSILKTKIKPEIWSAWLGSIQMLPRCDISNLVYSFCHSWIYSCLTKGCFKVYLKPQSSQTFEVTVETECCYDGVELSLRDVAGNLKKCGAGINPNIASLRHFKSYLFILSFLAVFVLN